MKKIVFAAVLFASPAYAGNNWNEVPYTNMPQSNPIQGVLDAARNLSNPNTPMLQTPRQCITQPLGNGWTTTCY